MNLSIILIKRKIKFIRNVFEYRDEKKIIIIILSYFVVKHAKVCGLIFERGMFPLR